MHQAILDVFAVKCARRWPADSAILLEMYPPLQRVIELCARPKIEAVTELLRCGSWLDVNAPADHPGDEFFVPQYCRAALQPPKAAPTEPSRTGVRTYIDLSPRDIVGMVFQCLRGPGSFLDWPHGMRSVRNGDVFGCSWYQYGVVRRDDGVPAAMELHARNDGENSVVAYSRPPGIPRYGTIATQVFDRNFPTVVVLRDNNNQAPLQEMIKYVVQSQSAFAMHNEGEATLQLVSFKHIARTIFMPIVRDLKA